jgi:copper chaperone
MSSATIRFEVPDVSCDHCKAAIEGALAPKAGVEQVEVEVAAKAVTVAYDPARIAPTEIAAAVEEQGYEVGSQAGG